MAQHYKRHMKLKRISVAEYCYQVIRRVSRRWPLKTRIAKKYIRRLTRRYAINPDRTANLLIGQMFDHNPVGIYKGEIIYDEWRFAFVDRRDAPLCMINQKHECFICGQPLPCEGLDHESLNHCLNEWCARLYEYFYVEKYGHQRPNLRKYGLRLTNVEPELRFNFFLSDYLRRQANEQTRS